MDRCSNKGINCCQTRSFRRYSASFPQQDAPTLSFNSSLTRIVCLSHFFSQNFKPGETPYSTFGRELLSVYKTIRHFRYVIEGRKFHVMTDHKPLMCTLIGNHDSYTTRETRHLAFISEYTTDHQVLGSRFRTLGR